MKFFKSLQRAYVGARTAFRADGGLGFQLPPWDDYWYTNRGYQTASGLRVSPESALRIAAVFACVRVVSETMASLPFIIYRKLPNGGKERATNHPLYKLLHDSPNPLQTSFEFFEMMQGHLELRGNAYAEIISGNGRAVDALVPIHPDRVIVKRLPGSGRLQYEIRNYYNASVEVKAQEEIFHLRGLSADGLVGMSTISIMAESLGTGLAAQEFAARFFENDSTPSGVLTHPKTLTEAAHDRIRKSWREQHTGQAQHSVSIIEEGMTYANIGMTNKDSQLIEARQFSRSDIASGFRVPLHKIGDLTRATFSNIEQQNIEFATDCIRPRAVRFERRIQMALIEALGLGDGEYFGEFLMEALMRGDQPSRYRSYAAGRQWGWLSPNDIRAMENMNPIEGGDEYLQPLNMVPSGTDNADQADENSDRQTDSNSAGASVRFRDFVQAAAERVVRKEVKALTRIAEKANGHFSEQVEEFYDSHAGYISQSMRVSAQQAALYASENCTRLSRLTDPEERVQVIQQIEEQGPSALADLVLKQKRLQ